MSTDPVTVESPAEEPVVATIVPPPPSPWQFGLKALLGLMAVCSLQFALMYYLGVMGGLGVAILVCAVALAAILLAAVLFVPSRTPLMERLDFVGIRLVVGIAILLVGTIFAGGGTAVVYSLTEMRTAMNLESDLGMRTVRAEVWDGKSTKFALRIVVIFPGSNAEKAGLRMGEVIVLDGTVRDFYDVLEKNRGGSHSFNVATSPISGSIEKSVQRQVTVNVPK